ncbi:hypothetical protein Lal_00032193 [Lupinus albus]|nr:hypothetical protein Lal_00032193 [Lupinus albus]
MEVPGSSSTVGVEIASRRDPYYFPTLQETGKIYPSLVREFYSNFQYKDGVYMSIVSGKLITLDEELFLSVGGLSSFGSPLGDFENESWESFDVVEMYKSSLRGPHFFKSGYVWSSSSRLLPHGIFISRIIDQLDIDTSEVDFILTNTREHLVGDNLIHKMSIYLYDGTWMYHEDYKTTMDLDLSDEEGYANLPEKNPDLPQAEASLLPQEPSFRLAHMDVIEQRLNGCFNSRFLSLNERIDYGLLSLLYDRVSADVQREAEKTINEIGRSEYSALYMLQKNCQKLETSLSSK